jgi:hypothetical protein
MRHEDPRGDFCPQNNSAKLIRVIINEGATVSTLTNDNVILKTNLTFDEMVDFQKNYCTIEQIEIKGTGTSINKISTI